MRKYAEAYPAHPVATPVCDIPVIIINIRIYCNIAADRLDWDNMKNVIKKKVKSNRLQYTVTGNVKTQLIKTLLKLLLLLLV